MRWMVVIVAGLLGSCGTTPEKLCSNPSTFDSLNGILLDGLKTISGNHPDFNALDTDEMAKLIKYDLVTVDSYDKDSKKATCAGVMDYMLPDDVIASNSLQKRQQITYTVQPSADGSGNVVSLANAYWLSNSTVKAAALYLRGKSGMSGTDTSSPLEVDENSLAPSLEVQNDSAELEATETDDGSEPAWIDANLRSMLTPDYRTCLAEDSSTMGMIDCGTAEAKRQDAALAAAVLRTTTDMDTDSRNQTMSEQLMWKAGRERQCKAEAGGGGDGSFDSAVYYGCTINENLKRLHATSM